MLFQVHVFANPVLRAISANQHARPELTAEVVSKIVIAMKTTLNHVTL